MISAKTTMLMQLASRSRPQDLHKLCPALIQHVKTKHTNVETDILQSYQGRDHEFGQHRAVEVLSKAMEMNEMGKNGNGPYVHGDEPGIHGDKSRVPSTDVCSRDKDIGNYNSQGTVSLSSVMQSNVPEPFRAGRDNDLIHDYGNPTYQNMPGGMAPLENRYVNSSRLDLKQKKAWKRGLSTSFVHQCEKLAGDNELSFPQGIQGSEEDKKRFAIFKENCEKYGLAECDELLQGVQTGRHTLSHVFDEQDKIIKKIQEQEDQRGKSDVHPLSQKERLKLAVKEYGATVVIFHISMSLTMLGATYLAISSGIDMVGLLGKLGVGQAVLESKAVTGASTFVISYAVYKCFMPLRIGITLSATPFIVGYLRKIGWLRGPRPVATKA